MNNKLKMTLCLSCLGATALSMSGVTIKGNIATDNINNVKLYLSDVNRNTKEIPLNEAKNGYSIDYAVESPSFVYLFGAIEYANGARSQTYAPIYVSPAKAAINIDLVNYHGAKMFDTSDSDNKPLTEYMEFFMDHMQAAPSKDAVNDIVPYLNRYTAVADSLAGTTTDRHIKDFLALQSYFDREMSTRHLEMAFKGSTQVFPANAREGMMPLEQLVNNPEVSYFPQVSTIVMEQVAKGKTLGERMTNLNAKIKNPALVKEIGDFLINDYIVNYDYSKGVDEGLATLASVAKNHPKYAAMVEQMKLRAYSASAATMPDVPIMDVNGKEHRLAEFKGKYVYVDFWASWCVPCRKEIPYMKELEKTLGNDQVVFVAISLDEDASAWKAALKSNKLEGNQFITGSKDLAQMLNVRSIPHYVIYDKDGRLMNPDAPRPSSGEELRTLLSGLK